MTEDLQLQIRARPLSEDEAKRLVAVYEKRNKLEQILAALQQPSPSYDSVKVSISCKDNQFSVVKVALTAKEGIEFVALVRKYYEMQLNLVNQAICAYGGK